MNLYENFCIDFTQNFNTFTINDLDNFKKNLSNDDLKNLERLTSELFQYEKYSVVYNRTKIAEKFDLHDYYSMGLYYWPDPSKPDGLPYISIDGKINKDSFYPCKEGLRKTAMITFLASLMYYFTSDKKYYYLLKEHLEYFFLNKDTYMNPNLEHSQLIPGDPKYGNGRGIGIIDFGACCGYAFVLLKNLYDKGMVEVSLYNSLAKWTNEFLKWLETSKNGNDEKNEKNNHGTMYTLLCAQLHFFLGDLENYKNSYLEELNNRLQLQINHNNGRMEAELVRTRALAYSTMNIKAFIDTYKLLNVNYTDNTVLMGALKFLTPYLNKELPLENIKVNDHGNIRGAMQIEGTYLNCYKLYLKYITKGLDININTDNLEDLPLKYYLK